MTEDFYPGEAWREVSFAGTGQTGMAENTVGVTGWRCGPNFLSQATGWHRMVHPGHVPASGTSPETSRVPSYGQKTARPVVSHPQTGHRFSVRSFCRSGMIGMNRKTKKKGKPRLHPTIVTTSESARRRTLHCHIFR
jgi:hypothetical protein